MRNAGEMVKKVSKLCGCKAALKARPHGITLPQLMVLSAVKQGKQGASDIAALLGADRPTMSGIIKRLSAAGLITAVPDKNDRRHKTLGLTPKSRSLLVKTGKCPQNAEKLMFKGFTKDEIKLFIGYLNRISENMEREK